MSEPGRGFNIVSVVVFESALCTIGFLLRKGFLVALIF